MNVIEDNNKIHISIHFDVKELQKLQQQHKIHILLNLFLFHNIYYK